MDPRNIQEHSKIHFSRDWFDLPVTSDDLTNYYKDTDESKFVVIISHDHRTVASCVAATTAGLNIVRNQKYCNKS